MDRFNGSAPVARYLVESWFERDRAAVWILDDFTGKTVVEWWDESVQDMVEAGYFDMSNLEDSVLEYAKDMGIIK